MYCVSNIDQREINRRCCSFKKQHILSLTPLMRLSSGGGLVWACSFDYRQSFRCARAAVDKASLPAKLTACACCRST